MTTTDVIAGKYKVVRMLGEGGMGQVFEAVNMNTERRVAIKTLHPRLSEDGAIVQRFLREARAATRVHHPNVVDVLDFDVDPTTKTPYLVQEFLVGESLYDALAAKPGRRFGVEDALAIIVPVMSALAAAHTLGVVHRDLKLDNVFLVRDARGAVTPKLIDFGIAKLLEGQPEGMRMTQTGAVMGTPGYMSPEQAGGAPDIDGRTDVWSVGVILYELLVGVSPYVAPNYNILVAKILFEDPTPIVQVDPGLRPEVAAVVQRALTRNRDGRFQTMQAMLDATLACVTDERVRTAATLAPPPPAAPVEPPTRAAGVSVTGPTMGYEPVEPAPTLGGWAGPPATPVRHANAVMVAIGVAVGVLAVSATVFLRAASPPPSAASPRTTIVHATALPPPVPPTAPAPAAPPVAAPAAPAVAAPAAPAIAAPAAGERLNAVRTRRGRHRRPSAAAPPAGGDFGRGYPQ